MGLGSDFQNTPTVTVPNHGFSGWMQQTFTFTATSTTEVLSFLAVGDTPVPPFLLLDGVTVDEYTPEPGSVYLMLSGLTLLGGVTRFRQKRSAKG